MCIARSVRSISYKRQCNTYQTAATVERIITNARHAVGNGNARQTAAFVKRRISNARHGVWNRNARQTGTTGKRSPTNARSTRDHNRL